MKKEKWMTAEDVERHIQFIIDDIREAYILPPDFYGSRYPKKIQSIIDRLTDYMTGEEHHDLLTQLDDAFMDCAFAYFRKADKK